MAAAHPARIGWIPLELWRHVQAFEVGSDFVEPIAREPDGRAAPNGPATAFPSGATIPPPPAAVSRLAR